MRAAEPAPGAVKAYKPTPEEEAGILARQGQSRNKPAIEIGAVDPTKPVNPQFDKGTPLPGAREVQ